MELTPLDIHHKEFHRAIRGYNEEEVDVFLDKVADGFERLFNENRELKELTDKMKDKVSKYEGLEQTMQKAILTAQRAADEVQSSAVKESELIVRDAELKAKEIIQDIDNQKRQIHEQLEGLKSAERDFRDNFKSLLKEYLGTIKKVEAGDVEFEETAPEVALVTEEEKVIETVEPETEPEPEPESRTEQTDTNLEEDRFEDKRSEFKEEAQLEKDLKAKEDERESAASIEEERIPATDSVSTEELYRRETEIHKEEPTVFIPPPGSSRPVEEPRESDSPYNSGDAAKEESESKEEEKRESASVSAEENAEVGDGKEKKTQEMENFFDNSSFFEESKSDDKDENREEKQSGPDFNNNSSDIGRDAPTGGSDLSNKPSGNDGSPSITQDNQAEPNKIDYGFPEPGNNEPTGMTDDVSTFFDDNLGSE